MQELSQMKTISMKAQILFSGKNKKYNLNLSAELAQTVLKNKKIGV